MRNTNKFSFSFKSNHWLDNFIFKSKIFSEEEKVVSINREKALKKLTCYMNTSFCSWRADEKKNYINLLIHFICRKIFSKENKVFLLFLYNRCVKRNTGKKENVCLQTRLNKSQNRPRQKSLNSLKIFKLIKNKR